MFIPNSTQMALVTIILRNVISSDLVVHFNREITLIAISLVQTYCWIKGFKEIALYLTSTAPVINSEFVFNFSNKSKLDTYIENKLIELFPYTRMSPGKKKSVPTPAIVEQLLEQAKVMEQLFVPNVPEEIWCNDSADGTYSPKNIKNELGNMFIDVETSTC